MAAVPLNATAVVWSGIGVALRHFAAHAGCEGLLDSLEQRLTVVAFDRAWELGRDRQFAKLTVLPKPFPLDEKFPMVFETPRECARLLQGIRGMHPRVYSSPSNPTSRLDS